jgi:hypothetical protein
LALLDFGSISAVQLFIKINIICLIRKLLNSSWGIYFGMPFCIFFSTIELIYVHIVCNYWKRIITLKKAGSIKFFTKCDCRRR